MLTVRPAAMSDLDAMTDIEAQSFPPEEKATRESFEARMKVFPECFMLLCEDGRPVGLIDGMVTNDATISDPMFENASLHDRRAPGSRFSASACFLKCAAGAPRPC